MGVFAGNINFRNFRKLFLEIIMRLILVSTFFFVSVLNVSSVFAQPYFSISGMFVNAEDSDIEHLDTKVGTIEYDAGFGISGAVGNKFANGLRIETEYTYRKATADVINIPVLGLVEEDVNEDIKTHTILANVVYDFKLSGGFSPYLGAGLGIGWVEDAEGAEFAYQVLTGINYAVSESTDFIVGYRYTGMTDIEVATNVDLTVDTHNFEIGMRFSL